jgi:hypothetical protein|tara:strand:+ start:75 stop:254 length:180 start_codon:yes stop_codon:yes gene_type:complete
MNRDEQFDFIDDELQQVEDERSLLATFALVVKELAIKHPNDQELGAEVKKLIQDYKLNT